MSESNVLLVSDQEHATILNALRYWQSAGRPVFPEFFEDVGDPVAEDDLDEFIERINSNYDMTVMCVIESGIVSQAYVPDAKARILLHVFDLDTDTIDEEDLTELPVPLQGIQTGRLYSVQEHVAAPDFLNLLNQKIQQDVLEAEVDSANSSDQIELALAESQMSIGIDLMEQEGISAKEREQVADQT